MDFHVPKSDGWMDNMGIVHFKSDVDNDLTRSNPPRGRLSYPYSYDPFTVWGKRDETSNASVWTDRLLQWNYRKFRVLGKRVWKTGGEMVWFNNMKKGNAEKVERFLRLYYNNPTIKLTRIVEYCNASNGFPVWHLIYRNERWPEA